MADYSPRMTDYYAFSPHSDFTIMALFVTTDRVSAYIVRFRLERPAIVTTATDPSLGHFGSEGQDW